MKITPNDLLKNVIPQDTKNAEKPSEGKFIEILQQAFENTSTHKSQNIGPPPAQSMPEIRFDPLSFEHQTHIVARVKEFLNVFEEYQKKLGDPELTLKDIHPVVTQMDEQTKGLLPLLDSLPEGDEIKEILNSTLIYSSIEIAKFNRGDYMV